MYTQKWGKFYWFFFLGGGGDGGWVSEGLREESAKNEVWIDKGNFLLLVHIVHKEYDSIYYLRWEIKKKCYMNRNFNVL